ncbi:hypothetical protein MN608_04497 [Microdochium nivale]|nr:hypothetical protein MN608_04497 [Microdochium nivale]
MLRRCGRTVRREREARAGGGGGDGRREENREGSVPKTESDAQCSEQPRWRERGRARAISERRWGLGGIDLALIATEESREAGWMQAGGRWAAVKPTTKTLRCAARSLRADGQSASSPSTEQVLGGIAEAPGVCNKKKTEPRQRQEDEEHWTGAMAGAEHGVLLLVVLDGFVLLPATSTSADEPWSN